MCLAHLLDRPVATYSGGERRRLEIVRLYLSAKTADHHIQHVYTKIGVSTRAAAALWAMRHALVG
jgi:ABC-type lipopolysaccharide export system ATPase subunit